MPVYGANTLLEKLAALIEDGHSTYDDGEITARQLIERVNRELSQKADIRKAGQISFGKD